MKADKKYINNLVSGLLCQIVAAVIGLILPGLILKTYGSVLNGLMSVITQILHYLSLMEMGIYNASLVALYKPLAEKNYKRVSNVLSEIFIYYKKISIYFSIGTIAIGLILPLIIKEDIPLATIWLSVLAVAGINLTTYLLVGRYKVLLQANDQIYICNYVKILEWIIRFVLSLVVIYGGYNIAFTKIVLVITNMMVFAVLYWYCKSHFSMLDFDAVPTRGSIKQRRDILVRQITALVTNNTDVLLLTIFGNSLSLASVYTMYEMINTLMQNVLSSIINAISAKLGHLIALKEYNNLKKILSKYELLYDTILFCLYTCMAVLLIPFMKVYTRGVEDANYILPTVAIFFSIKGAIRMLRLPYSEVVANAGHYKETKVQTINETWINLVVSFVLLPKYGIIGVLVGTIIAEIYRTIHLYYYVLKNMFSFNIQHTIFRLCFNIMLSVFVYSMSTNMRIYTPADYLSLFAVIIVFFVLSSIIFCLFNWLYFMIENLFGKNVLKRKEATRKND